MKNINDYVWARYENIKKKASKEYIMAVLEEDEERAKEAWKAVYKIFDLENWEDFTDINTLAVAYIVEEMAMA